MSRKPLAFARLFRNLTLAIGLLSVLAVPARAQVARDMINLSQTAVYNSPADVASWPITHSITGIHMSPSGASDAGLSFQSSALAAWPDYTPPGWDGPLEYTVWAVVNINGSWYTSGFIQMWRGRVSTGAPLLTDFARNWAYDSRWGPMQGHQPVVGEQMGFFLTSGNARGVGTVTSLRERTNVVLVSLPAGDSGTFAFANTPPTIIAADFDGDHKADIGVYTSSSDQRWIGLSSSTNFASSANVRWGAPGDIAVPADYDGDGRADVAVWRPSDGVWYILTSSSNFTQSRTIRWGSGTVNDVPVAADYDGDGKADLAVWRPGDGVWWVLTSSSNYTASLVVRWGSGALNDIPVPADYDGDGKADMAVWRPGSGVWWILTSSSGFTQSRSIAWGAGSVNDIPVVGDYDGDGKADLAVWRPGSGVWYILTSASNYTQSQAIRWGAASAGDQPIVADFDGDGKADLVVWRSVDLTWWVLKSSSNYTQYFTHVFGG
jgi:hypothetical protein